MPTATANKRPPAGAPSEEELQAAQFGIIPARIFRRDVQLPAAVAAKILNERGDPLTPEQLFPFVGRPSNNLPDFYSTFQTMGSLRNYEQEAKDGSALLLVHDIYDLPVGKSYNSWIEIDEVSTPEDRAAAIERRGGARLALPLAPDDPLAWLFIEFYMVRGLNLGKKPNDEVIRGIMSGTLEQMSITFYASMFRCTICGMDIWDWDCPHIPGVEYDLGDAGEVLCLGAVEDGHLVETSLVYKGATPGALVVETKARMLAASQRLTSPEVRQLAAIEAKLGRRLVDPAYMSRALGTTVVVPGTGTQARTQKENVMTRKNSTGTGKRDITDPAATDTTTDTSTAELEQVIADQATSDAAAIADQIEAKNGQIAALEEANAGLEEQIATAQNATDDAGNAVDNTELIAGFQAQIEANNTLITNLEAEVQALNDELTGVNATADATGGTTTEAPAADATTTDTTGTVSMQLVGKARAALGQMRAMFTNHIAALRPHGRSVAGEPRKQVAANARELTNDLNSLLTDMGEEPGRCAADQVVFGALRRATGVQNPGIVQVRQLVQEASAGRTYLKDLQDACVRERVRAVGADKVNEEQYRRMLRSLDVAGLQAELDTQGASAKSVFTPGRRVLPTESTGSVDVPNKPNGSGNGASNQTAPGLNFGN